MDEVRFDQELERPIDRRRRSSSPFAVEAIQNLIGSRRLVAIPDQLENTSPQPSQAEPPRTANVFRLLKCGLHTVFVVVVSRWKMNCGRSTSHCAVRLVLSANCTADGLRGVTSGHPGALGCPQSLLEKLWMSRLVPPPVGACPSWEPNGCPTLTVPKRTVDVPEREEREDENAGGGCPVRR